ncbi:hypothetical protein HPB51_020023 [Rhipicephalus microplus]|uniref:Uncharacterized protein n=1 Tax=Rhipicephalus microplus TaxID=6941 RepID=A0A9J6EP40_RHIMP|nr:hypothetical protein HPB51_020023 [Rhipicephalus microplus]
MDQPPSQIPPPAKQRSARFYFTPEVDIFLLREVLAVDPFEDSSRWAAIARNLSAVLLRNVVARSLRDHLDLLLAQFAARGRKNLRSAVRKVAAAAKQQLKQEQAKLEHPPTEKKIAAAIRDLRASEFEVTGREWMSVDEDVLSSHDEDNMWSRNVYDLGEAQASATCDDCELLASVPQLPASHSVTTTGQTAASSSVLVQDFSPSPSHGIFHEPSPCPTLNTTPDRTLDPTSACHPSPILDPARGSSPAPPPGSSSGLTTGPTSGPTSGSSPGPTQGPTSGLLPTIAKGYMRTPPGICLKNRTFQFTTV